MVCSNDTEFNPTTNQCQKKSPNSTQICSIGATYNYLLLKCVCPDITPYDNGAVCIACNAPYFWNVTSQMCSQCLDGSVYNPTYQICQLCPIDSPI